MMESNHKTILVIDDDLITHNILKPTFAKAGSILIELHRPERKAHGWKISQKRYKK